jgi:hypothetical protein
VVNAEGRIQLEEQLLHNARHRLDLVERQFRIAAARPTDLLGAEVEVATRNNPLPRPAPRSGGSASANTPPTVIVRGVYSR